VTDMELAMRLARFIWNGRPDGFLLQRVEQRTLKEPAVLEAEVRRMLQSYHSSNLVTNFFWKWLALDDFDSEAINQVAASAASPQFDAALRNALRMETHSFLENQLQSSKADRSALDLLSGNYTFLNGRLAGYYGIPGISGDEFRQVTLSGQRAGLLGHGSILTLTSIVGDARTSPTLRGKWISEVLLGIPVPPPPPNTPEMIRDLRPVRQRLEETTSSARCAACHRIFDPLGFSLENFDAFGRWRDAEAGAPINASGAFADGTKFNTPAEFRAGLMKYRDAYLVHATQKLMVYALGRGVRNSSRVYPFEMPAVRAILREAEAHGYSWISIITGIVKSDHFQKKNLVP
jgi:hypothetical protein